MGKKNAKKRKHGKNDSQTNNHEDKRHGKEHALNEGSSCSTFSDSDGDSEEGSDQEVVYADFEFFDPKQDDFHGVKSLLSTYCDGKDWALSGFVEIILAQSTVGTVIKTDEDCLFGIITVLNLARYKNENCLKDIRQFLLENCSEEAKMDRLKALFDRSPHDVGLLVCERVINLPFALIPPLYDALFDEVSWATEDEPTHELRESFKFKQYLILTRVYQMIPETNNSTKSKKRKKRNSSSQGANGKASEEQLIYLKPEDEVFHQLCSWWFTFAVEAERLAAHEMDGMRQMRLVMAIDAKKMGSFRLQLKNLAGL
eukprot:TRINITY_DN8674_c0_g1_i1.p1 TRINITY_DN8674_c0_g1~~TRINITY_DN8674_c0_g1_i1.p1  ORF type:complete len:314 (+),score=70.92 TRINITY_DN8674_c0_g1_i1:236-1177(+)